MVLDGVEYRKNAGALYEIVDELPNVGQINSIYLANGNTVLFEVDCFRKSYNSHFHANELEPLNSNKILTINDLVLVNPVHIPTTSALASHKMYYFTFLCQQPVIKFVCIN